MNRFPLFLLLALAACEARSTPAPKATEPAAPPAPQIGRAHV